MNKKSEQKTASQPKKQVKKQNVSHKKTKHKSNILPYINMLMPYILSVLFVVFMFSSLGFAGKFGAALSGFFKGLFSVFALYCIWVFMLYHALMWYRDVNKKICARRVICSLVTISLVSTLQYLIQTRKHPELLVKTAKTLFQNGKAGQGGGVIGGFLGNLLLNFGTFLAFAIVIVLLIFLLLQMADKTPAYIVRYIFDKKKDAKETASAEGGKKRSLFSKKHKKFDVYVEDDDDISEENLEKLGFSDTNIPIPTEDESLQDDTKEEVFEVERETYEEAVWRGNSMEHSSQIKPYNPSDYEKSHDEPNEKESVKENNVFNYGDEIDDDDVSKTNEKSWKDDIYSEDKDKDLDDEPKKPENDYGFTFSYGNDDKKSNTDVSYPDWDFDDEKDEKADDGLNDFNDFDDIDEKDEFDDVDEIDDMDEPDEIDETDEIDESNLSDYLSAEVSQKIGLQKAPETKPVEPKNDFTVEKKPMFAEPEPPAKKEKQDFSNYKFPPFDFLNAGHDNSNTEQINEELQENARIIVETLNNFNVRTRIVDVRRGPTVTRYELMPEPGVRVSKIAGLIDDIALNLAAEGIRIECPIPGKSAVGIEVPNKITSFVFLRSLLEDPKFKSAKSSLNCALGKNISGENVYLDIEKMPHLLVAGSTGMGKSVCINSLLVSLLYKARPDEVRLILIDPKQVEFSNYDGIPHLLVPVVCDAKKSLGALQWAVSEMEKRFETIRDAGVRNIIDYNEKIDKSLYDGEKMPRIVIIIDELADLKMSVPEIEDHIMRLTQKARAAGIHIIIGTQRPSVDVITGVIKANIPSRIAFRVSSNVDSRTILDEAGAEKLVSKGDMLFKSVGSLNMLRVQGAFVRDEEIALIVDFLKQNASANYDEEVMHQIDSNAQKLSKNDKKDFDGESSDGPDDDLDPKFYDALDLAVKMGKISSSLLQRKLGLGFQRAARLIDQMEERGYIGEPNGSKPRDVLISQDEFYEIRMRNDDNLD